MSHSFIGNYTVYLSVLKLTPAEYATNTFSSKKKYENLALVGPVVKKLGNWSFAERTAKGCTKNYNAHAQPLFCSLSLLF